MFTARSHQNAGTVNAEGMPAGHGQCLLHTDIFFQATFSISRDVAISKNKFTSSEFSLLTSRNGQNRAVQKTISHLLQLSDEGTQSGLELLHDLIQNHR